MSGQKILVGRTTPLEVRACRSDKPDSAIRGHDCPFCTCGIRIWATLTDDERRTLRADCNELRRIEAGLTRHRLFLNNPKVKSAKQVARWTRSLEAGEGQASRIRSGMRVVLGLEDPQEVKPLWD